MVPGPRSAKGLDRPAAGRDRARALRSLRPGSTVATGAGEAPAPPKPAPAVPPGTVTVTRTSSGWSVVAPDCAEPVADLVEGMTLADLVAEELGGVPQPDRAARRSARGKGPDDDAADPRDARIAALERTVAQLEHALAARVATERAIGMLAERHGTCPREAFEALRREARSQGRAVQELAAEVLAGRHDPASPRAASVSPITAASAPAPRTPSFPQAAPAGGADGSS